MAGWEGEEAGRRVRPGGEGVTGSQGAGADEEQREGGKNVWGGKERGARRMLTSKSTNLVTFNRTMQQSLKTKSLWKIIYLTFFIMYCIVFMVR